MFDGTYDAAQVNVIVEGIPLSGMADGTFVTVDMDSDAFTKYKGTDGHASRSKSNDFCGTITVTLAQSSPSNDILSALAQRDRLSNTGVVPVLVQDLSGTSVYASAFAWVRKKAKGEFGKEIGPREWVFDAVDLDMHNGGTLSI